MNFWLAGPEGGILAQRGRAAPQADAVSAGPRVRERGSADGVGRSDGGGGEPAGVDRRRGSAMVLRRSSGWWWGGVA
jgi:hypothetical protein